MVLEGMEGDRMRGCADDETTMTTPLHGSPGRREVVSSSKGCIRQKRVSVIRARADGGWRRKGVTVHSREFNGAGSIICVDSGGTTQRRKAILS